MSVEVTRLPNGLWIATDHMSHVETASIGVWVKAGSRSETGREHGLAHLLEHMAFKGTQRRSARDIAIAIEAVGGDLNAATSLETTAYHARVMREDVGLAIGLLVEILQESVFDPTELKREQNVIAQEIGAVADTPEDLVFDLFQEAAFPGQPIGRPILGTVESVGRFSRNDILHYLEREYRGPAMVLAAAGAVSHEEVVTYGEKHFGNLPSSAPPKPQDATYIGGEKRLDRDLEQVNLVIGLEGVSWGDPRFETAQVLANLLGGGMSSRLFQEVREKHGLCYQIHAFHWGFEDTGILAVSAATGEEDLDRLVAMTAAEVVRVEHDAETIEVDRVKAQLKASLLMSFESSMLRAERLARQLLAFGRVTPMEEMTGRIESVDVDAVRSLAKTIISAGRPTLAAVGPLGRLEAIDRIAEKLASRSSPGRAQDHGTWPYSGPSAPST